MGEFAENKEVGVLLGDPKKAIKSLSVPIAVALLLQQANMMVSTVWVTGLGSGALAALGIVNPFFCVILAIGNGLGIGASAALARNIGMKRLTNAECVAAQGLTLMAIAAVFVTPIMLITAEPVLAFAGAGNSITHSLEYARPLYSCAFIIMMSCMIPSLLRGEGAAKRSMYTQVAMAITNMVLDPIFIYGMNMGVAGAAWAMIVASLVATLMGLYWYIRKTTFIKLRIGDFRPRALYIKDIMSVGLPQTMELSIMYLFNMVYNFCILLIGSAGVLSAYMIVWRIIYLVLIPAQAVGGAMVSACSAEFGMRRYDMVKKAFTFSVRFSLISMAVLSVSVMFLADPLASIFTYAPDMRLYHGDMVQITLILMPCVPLLSLVFVGSSLLQAVKRSSVSMWSSIIRNLALAVSFILTTYLTGSLTGLWIVLSLVEVFGGLLMWYLAHVVLKALNKKDSPVPA